MRTPRFIPVRRRARTAAALLAVTALSSPTLSYAGDTGSLTPVAYGFTGKSTTGDSFINALFVFDAKAMSDQLVFTYEITQHTFTITGDSTALNGDYDRFLGGGLTFSSSVPGPKNLPIFQSLAIQNSSTLYFVRSDGFGNPNTFLGGPGGSGTTYTGQWSFVIVPEPSAVSLLVMGMGALGFLKWRRIVASPNN